VLAYRNILMCWRYLHHLSNSCPLSGSASSSAGVALASPHPWRREVQYRLAAPSIGIRRGGPVFKPVLPPRKEVQNLHWTTCRPDARCWWGQYKTG
jgi:hypothetical protein